MSSPNVESHLITSVGEYYYCALAKGPLVPDHVLILPIEHEPNTLSLPSECEMELERFQNSLKAYFKKQGKEAVFFEWVFKRGTHANLQVWKATTLKFVLINGNLSLLVVLELSLIIKELSICAIDSVL